MGWDLQSLFRRHSKEITRSLRRRGLTAETAADITQDAFLRLMTSATPGDSVANPRAFLFQVSRNLCTDFERRQKFLPLADLTDEAFATIADQSPTAETAVYDRQRLAISAAALDELPERTRRAFELHRMEELTVNEVAKELGLSATRTWSLIKEAYLHVRARLDEASRESR